MRLCVEADQLGLYCEVTVSGCGLRFIGLSHQGAELHRRFAFQPQRRGAGAVPQHCARFITISGLQEGPCETMGEIDGYLDELLARFDGQPAAANSPRCSISTTPARSRRIISARSLRTAPTKASAASGLPKWSGILPAKACRSRRLSTRSPSTRTASAPNMPNRLLAEVTRCFNKWKTQRLAAVTGMVGGAVGSATGSAAVKSSSAWPQIKVIPSELPRIVNEAEDALLLLGQEFYQRGGMLVRPVTGTIVNKDGKTEGWQLIQVARPYLVETLCCAAQFVQIDGRGKTKGLEADRRPGQGRQCAVVPPRQMEAAGP